MFFIIAIDYCVFYEFYNLTNIVSDYQNWKYYQKVKCYTVPTTETAEGLFI